MNIHFIGAAGVSMAQLADLAEEEGHTVTRSDLSLSGHDSKKVQGAELVVYSAAIPPSNPELLLAKKQNIPLMSRAEFLSRVCGRFQNTIAVSGSHGKTSTVGMLAEIFKDKSPAVHIGGDYAPLKKFPPSKNRFFITEACEYKNSFLSLSPDLAIVLNAELDHTDFFKTQADYFGSFERFCKRSQSAALCGDDPALYALAKKEGYATFGLAAQNDYRAVNIAKAENGATFDFYESGTFLGAVRLNVLGGHNVLNALAAAAAARIYALPFLSVAGGLARFSGVSRRLEFLGVKNGAAVYTDYAHHPTELNAAYASLRAKVKSRIIAVFEPHTYSRTQSLYREFAHSLKNFDRALLLPIYAAREQPISGVTHYLIADESANASVFKNAEELFLELKNILRLGDTLVFCGAGTVDGYAREFVKSER